MTLKRMFAAAGSIFDICPSTDYSRFVPPQTPEEHARDVAAPRTGVAAAALVLGHETAAGIIGGTTLVGLASVFVLGKVLPEK